MAQVTVSHGSQEYIMRLSHAEARFLSDILGQIGGHPMLSRRQHADDIKRALTAAGLSVQYDQPDLAERNPHDTNSLWIATVPAK